MHLRLLLASIVTFSGAAGAAGDGKLRFNRDIRPILSDNCFACHGFDTKKREAGLRLDTPEGAYAVTDGVQAIKPGDLKRSEVWTRINSDDEDEVMPPPESHKKLNPRQKASIKRWIEEGAAYQMHWAFEAPVKPVVPVFSSLSSVVSEGGNAAKLSTENSAPRTHPIDAFIIDRLLREGLSLSPEANRETLVRRVAFTLTGLPPTVNEVDEFMADKAPDAYEKMVERHLASPRHGEEMARHWLDVARYGDTHGLHLDNERQMWAYRDWVVRAFNDNLPFDQFTIWQLAGDLLPNATRDQLVATGFNRCNVTTSEGGAIAEEFVHRYAVDRTSTTIETWMGLTAGCAVCHDHKFDPLTTKEFYSLYSFFHSAADPGMDGNVSTTAPFVDLPLPSQQETLKKAAQREADELKRLDTLAAGATCVDPSEIDPPPAGGTVRDVLFDDAWPIGGVAKNTTRNATAWTLDPAFGAHSGRRVLHQRNSFFHEDSLGQMLAPITVPAQAQFEVWVRLDPNDPPQVLAVALETTAGKKRAWWGGEAAAGPLANLPAAEKRGPLPKPGEWSRLAFRADDLGLKEGQHVTGFTLQEAGGIVWWDAFTVAGESNPAADTLASFTAWWNAATKKESAELPADLRKVFAAGPGKEATPGEVAHLRAFYLSRIARPVNAELAKQRDAWLRARVEKDAASAAITGTFVFRDLDKPRDSFVMVRGQYDKPGDKVEPATPAVFPALKKARPDVRATRLDLAKWLVSPEHPTTARVTANRFWQQIFGTGLVKTSNDFGSQGEMPSHPELLDWLAVHFRESGWDVKALVRLMVTSATFRQSSVVTPDLVKRDPENRLYARGPRFRLDAEQLRDNALFVSGLINLEMGGRGVMPYQPPNIWEPVGYGDSNTRYYLQDHGAALYRRSLYTFIKRTAPAPFLTNFDAPNREQSCARRERSNTPLQALQLMNDVQHFEAARAFAEQLLLKGGSTPAERIAHAYRCVLARLPTAEETAIVTQALERHIARYAQDAAAARKVISNGESKRRADLPAPEFAAWTLVANLILNLDETVTRN
jgi:hypothetical protein